jgi:prophage tail gpP-like protein
MSKVFDTTKPFKCGCTVKEIKEKSGLRVIPDLMCEEGKQIWEAFEPVWDEKELWTWVEPEGEAVKEHFSAENQVD